MDENTSYVPKLTLNPTAAQAAVEEAPVEEDKEEEKEPVKAEKLDISSLSPAEQAAVREFSEQIDILNTEYRPLLQKQTRFRQYYFAPTV